MSGPTDKQADPHAAGAEESTPQAEGGAFPVVGIGASAGGLEAMKEFFGAMPADNGMAFVVVQHLEPRSESRMAEILAKTTTMKVGAAEDGVAVEPNSVYTNPPGRPLSIREGRLVLGKPTERLHLEAAIDHFLVSLAEDQGPTAVCIILSGSSGVDGPRGVRAVRAAGGMCMAQTPSTAQFPSMPQAAIDTGLADYVLPPSEMPASLLEFARHPQMRRTGDKEDLGEAAGSLETVLKLLRTRTNSDYTHYKRTTISRRIERRMGLRQIASMDEYVKLLHKDAEELTQLSKDMLIGVSSFFRNGQAFETLLTEIVAPLVQARADDEPLRAWVAGCATGEEAYSIAMLLLEARSATGKSHPVQVFATDVDDKALETARAGVYPLSVADNVSPQRVEAFFTKRGQTLQVDKHLREAVVFSRHNLLADPPFSKLDLVSCRNVLIYLNPPAQKKVLSVFSFALNVGGCLLLGKSEGVVGLEDLFEPVSKQDRIYRLTRSNRRAAGDFPLYAAGRPASAVEREQAAGKASILPQANLDTILRHFDASVVLIDPEGKILYFHGRTEKYMGHPKGPASLNILDMTGGSLSAKLRLAMQKALGHDEPIRLAQVPLPQEGSPLVSLTVMRAGNRADGGRLLAVIFEDAQPPQPPHPPTTRPVATEDEPLLTQLEAEVKALRTELRTNVEGYDAATEELKAANEEVMSMNEELQSANEELEASKEELQSVNEELTTVNSQLNENVNELTKTNNDLANLLTATEIATVFLDAQLRIRRFTPRSTELLNLIKSDLGRPIDHITQNFVGGDLAADAETVLKTLSPIEKEVQARDGRWYTVRILPYRTLDNRIDGGVITFSDVSRLKETENHLRYEKSYTQSIVDTVHHPLIVLDDELRVLSANPAFLRTFKIDANEIVGDRFCDLGSRQWDIPQLRGVLQEVATHGQRLNNFEVRHEFPTFGPRIMLLNARRIEGTETLPHHILMAIEDVTQREKDREALSALNADLEQRVTNRTALADRRSDQLRQLAAELARSEQRERERLARVLHDNLQQLLVAAKFQLATVRCGASDERSRNAADLMDDLLKQSLEASRSLTVELSPTILYEGGLEAALPWLARLMETRQGLKVQTEINAAVPQDEAGVAFLLFSSVRELLLNVAKHAGVDWASVQLDRLDGDLVRVIVSDEGKGFDPASLQGNDQMTGLGLFGLRERLEHIGGQCVIDSAPERGTRVTLTAEVARPTEQPRTSPPRKQPSIAASPEGKRSDDRVRVLLVDDHAIVRQGLAGILDAEPDIAVIAEAGDGQEAVEQARRHRPDVIIMDISMPGMNGIDATKAIIAELPDTKVIGLSMSAEADQGDSMQQAGAAAYLSKGGPSEQLIAAIRLHSPKRETRIKALLVEDSTPAAQLLLETLGKQGGESLEITHTETLAEAAALLEQQHFDVILLDPSLPDSAGMDTLDRVRSLAPGTPTLVLSSADDETIRKNALARGAEGYLVKGDASAEAMIKAIHGATERTTPPRSER